MFCPTCSSTLHERAILDVSLQGFRCDHGHLFYMTLVEQRGYPPSPSTIKPPAATDDSEILTFWLTDRAARRALPNQCAIVCRRILEIVNGGPPVPKIESPFLFCLTCARELAHVDSDNLYQQRLLCPNHHEFWWRGSTLDYSECGAAANFSAELDDAYLPTLVAHYVSDGKYVWPYVHPEIRGVLNRFMERRGHDPG